jgi:hypothetical protein
VDEVVVVEAVVGDVVEAVEEAEVEGDSSWPIRDGIRDFKSN